MPPPATFLRLNLNAFACKKIKRTMTRQDSSSMPPKRSEKVPLGINISQSLSGAVIRVGYVYSLLLFTAVRLRLAFIYRCLLAVQI